VSRLVHYLTPRFTPAGIGWSSFIEIEDCKVISEQRNWNDQQIKKSDITKNQEKDRLTNVLNVYSTVPNELIKLKLNIKYDTYAKDLIHEPISNESTKCVMAGCSRRLPSFLYLLCFVRCCFP
jgi:hypothetical protein